MTVAPPEIDIDPLTLESLDFEVPCDWTITPEGDCVAPARWVITLRWHCKDGLQKNLICQHHQEAAVAGRLMAYCTTCDGHINVSEFIVRIEPLKETHQ